MNDAAFAAGLPVADILPQLVATLRTGNVVLVAPPGAGKTTTVPLALMQAGFGRILVLEPRRLAARAAAQRMSHLLGEPVGTRIGFRTRLESAVSDRTVVEVITEGLLTSRLLGDPGLTGIAAIIFDEVHERSLEADLALALTLDLQRTLRPELRVLAMSATADVPRLSAVLNATSIESAGQMFPVEIIHSKGDIPSARELPLAAAKAIREALATHAGDILVFLPGMAEIRRTEAALAGCPATVLALHGDLSPAAQDLALTPGPRRRVVLATSIAETSLTVPGVRIVIDGGFRRSPRLDVGSGLTRLVTLRISRAAAAQRAGRAGREAPGVAIRLWSEALFRGMPAYETPEIFDSELSHLALSCAAWGEAPGDLPFPDAPPAGALKAAGALLVSLGALSDGRITPLGRQMSRLRAHPRLAAMMCAAQTPGETALAADLAALLEERDILGRDASADILLRLAALAGGGGGAVGEAAGDAAGISRVRHAARLYRARLGAGQAAAGHAGGLLAAGFPDRVGQARGAPGSYRLAGGGSAALAPADPLSRARLIVAPALEAKGGRVRLAAALDPDELPPALTARCTVVRDSGFEPVSGTVLIRERVRLGALILADKSVPAGPQETQAALAQALSTRLDMLDWSDAVASLIARVSLLRGLDPELPDISRAALAATVQDWLAPYLAGMTNIREAKTLDLYMVLRNHLGRDVAARLDRALPETIRLARGPLRIDYTGPVPVASARAQAFYGTDTTPALAGGRIALQLSLLSPAGRPIAITGDLAAFWRAGWADARRDMRGRYPRQDWPERPWEAVP
jgi:ATP-dependent helicase HrpB